MQLHGLAAFAGLFVFGVMAAAHLPHGWRLSRRLRWAHQRRSGIVLCALAATLALSGYLLYYFAPEWVRPSWAGAMIATAFIELPWLQAMTFELTASAEYDDDGGSYRSITVAVRDVVPVNGADIPEDFGGNFDDVDAELAADEISERFDQESSLLYAAFENGSGDFSDFTFRVDRDAIAEILATGDVKGKKAFVALFPAYAYRVTC